MAIKIFEVGGHVRDSLLGIESKDIDCAVEASSFEEMHRFVEANTQKIFLVKEEFLTIRAMGNDGLVKDFVLCRKDGVYSDGRRPDSVEPGTIYDDLARRDFTINAIAKDVETGELIDPFDGQLHLTLGLLKCVGKAEDRFNEDALRIIRAIRFCITKDLVPDLEVYSILQDEAWAEKLRFVSTDRIRQELLKCFQFGTVKTIQFLNEISPAFLEVMFSELHGELIWLKPTTEKK